MSGVTIGTGFNTFETYLQGFSALFPDQDFTFPTLTVNGQAVGDYLDALSTSGQPVALQLSTTEIAARYGTSTPIYLIAQGTGLSLPHSNLNGPVDLDSASGTLTSINLYSGGTFANGVLT